MTILHFRVQIFRNGPAPACASKHFCVQMMTAEHIVINPFGTVEFYFGAHCTTNSIGLMTELWI
jgi:hypothetical protein